LTPQQVLTWRREARERAKENSAVSFAPVVMATPAASNSERGAATLEVVIGAATVRIPPGIDAATLKTVLRAVRAAT
jgi:transposase